MKRYQALTLLLGFGVLSFTCGQIYNEYQTYSEKWYQEDLQEEQKAAELVFESFEKHFETKQEFAIEEIEMADSSVIKTIKMVNSEILRNSEQNIKLDCWHLNRVVQMRGLVYDSNREVSVVASNICNGFGVKVYE